MEKTIAILGSTGSIGTQTLEVVRENAGYPGGRFECRKQYHSAGKTDQGISSVSGSSLGRRAGEDPGRKEFAIWM